MVSRWRCCSSSSSPDFAANDILKNLASGLQILSTHPFAVGDWVLVNTFEGTVVNVGWRGTVLDTFDGRRVILPNSQIVTSAVINISAHNAQRLEAPFTVVSDADFTTIERVAREAALGVEGVLSEPAPQVLLTTLSGATMNVVTRFWLTAEPQRQRAILSEVMVAIRDGLRGEDIALAPPPAPHQPACPSCFSASATDERLALTRLRNRTHAHRRRHARSARRSVRRTSAARARWR